MTVAAFVARLDALPQPAPGSEPEREVELSIAYLASSDALASLEADSYWPKWDSPWWHMVLLRERGQAARIPRAAAEAMVSALDRLPVKIFPIEPGEMPAGLDPGRHASCHCALGCMAPLLLERGIDVDRALPWVRDWFVRYQMTDGGLNCDDAAYRVTNETPSSMVGTIAPFEAMLALTEWSARPEDLAFLDRAADFLVTRRLARGSDSVHNAEERSSAPDWRLPTFPRFYFYDVLRGLAALAAWAERFRRPLPLAIVADVVDGLAARDADGRIRVGRRAFDGKKTRTRSQSGEWATGRAPASTFPLLDASSRIGEPSAPLTRQWQATLARLRGLAALGLLVD